MSQAAWASSAAKRNDQPQAAWASSAAKRNDQPRTSVSAMHYPHRWKKVGSE
jgi:hypothetical protein